MRFVVFGDFTLGVLREGEVVDLSPALVRNQKMVQQMAARGPTLIGEEETRLTGMDREVRRS